MCPFSAHQKYRLNVKSLHSTPPFSFFSGEERLSRFVQAELPIQIDKYIASASTCSWRWFWFASVSCFQYVLPGGQYLLKSTGSETVVPSFLGDIQHAKKGVEGWVPAIFLASGVVAALLFVSVLWEVERGRLYSAELCYALLHWKLEGDSWGLSRQPSN